MKLIKDLSKRSRNISLHRSVMEQRAAPASRLQGGSHVPVLQKEVIEYLQPARCGVFLDGTIGLGGHAYACLKLMRSDSVCIGLDKDRESLGFAEEVLKEFKERLYLFHGDYKTFERHCAALNIKKVDGVLLDLGISSYQLEQSFRGFSFHKNAPLDMRMDRTALLSASDLVNNLSEPELAQILKHFGEERWHARIARRIVAERKKNPILSTQQLAEIITAAIPFRGGRIHPATRSFQALRIAVNRELESLEEFMGKIVEYLSPQARIGIISFHSLEDRIVKHALKRYAAEKRVKILTKKPVVPSEEEVAANKRARSAKLRVAERI